MEYLETAFLYQRATLRSLSFQKLIMKKKVSENFLYFLFAFLCAIASCKNEGSSPENAEEAKTDTTHITLPVPDHIVIVIEENRAYSQIIESPDAPYITSLSKDSCSANFTNAYAITHPSQPNYLYLFSGSNHGVTDNSHPANAPFTTPNLASELLGAGKSYVTYAEGLPSIGYDGDVHGAYARKHNPGANWMGKGINQIPDSTNQPFTFFPDDYSKLPTVSIIVPDNNNNMHNGSIKAGDTWLKDHLHGYIQWAKEHNSLFVLTYDEDDMHHGNHIVTIMTGAMIKGGTYAEQINHLSLLRTVENMYGLSYTGYALKAKTIRECWK
jgi:phospholipase C